ncbi:type VI secretion system contractile sheath small subunit [Salmonella enterica]|nr:type VI secretion system contractile sheath small subunit [Salmonella enterica]
MELPLNLLVTGDLTGGRDDTQLDERQPVAISRNNFNAGLGIEPITPDLLYFIDFYVFIFSRQAPDVLVAMRVCDFILCNMDYIGLIKCIVGQCV